MNRDIAILREAIVKLTHLLSDRKIRVTQQGMSAYVRSDKTGKPIQVNLPFIPDNSGEGLVIAIQGFLDHEVAHLLFTDFKVVVKANRISKRLANLHNVVEDTFIERMMRRKFPGSDYNITKTSEFFLSKMTDPAVKEAGADPVKLMSVLLVPAMRAWAGQPVFIEYMKDKWPLIADVVKTLGKLVEEVPHITNSEQGLDLAQRMEKLLFAPPKPKAAPDKSEGKKSEPKKAEKSKCEEGDSGDEDGEAGGGESKDEDEGEAGKKAGKEKPKETDPQPEKPKAEEPKSEKPKAKEPEEEKPEEEKPEEGEGDAPGSDDEAEDDEGEDEGDGAGDDDGEEDEEEGETKSSAADDEAEDEDEAEEPTAGKGDADAEDDADHDDDRKDDDAEGEDEADGDEEGESGTHGEKASATESGDASDADGDDASPEGEESEGAPPEGEMPEGEGGMSAEDYEAALLKAEDHDFDSSVAEAISKEACKAGEGAPYLIFTKDNDRIEPLEVNTEGLEGELAEVEETTRQMVGVMQKQLERAIAARSRVHWNPGQKSGRLHGAAMTRVIMGREDVFRRREVHNSKDVAVTLLIDCSGSMTGHGKIKVAAIAGYALASVIERIGIPCEVLGFTTFGSGTSAVPHDQLKRMEEEVHRMGRSYSRFEPIYMPIIKGFQERLTPQVKVRFPALYRRLTLKNNIDGECVEIAAQRLSKRREARKVLMVLSDGYPAAYGDRDEQDAHLKRVVKDTSKGGVECIGIGILDDSVKDYYPKCVILNTLEELPTAVMRELARVLLSGD